MIKPGTTPTNTFTLPIVPPTGTKLRIVYAQGEEYKEKVLFEKTGNDIEVDGKTLQVRLKAEETRLIDQSPKWSNGKFEPFDVKMQVGIETTDGTIIWSDVISEPPGRVLKPDGVV